MAVFDYWRLSRPVMPGLEASTWCLTLLSRGCRPWMHGSSPCMTNLADYRGRTILHIVSKNALYSIRSDTRLCGGEDREMSWRRFPGYVEVDTSDALREKPKRVARAVALGGTM